MGTGERDPLPTITTSDLNLRSGDVLRRVARGERLIVCRRHKPVATLQPLDGYVFQPFSGTVHDIFGWPFGDAPDQARALPAAQRALLLDGYRHWRVWPSRASYVVGSEAAVKALEEMRLTGLVKKTEVGNELTGRGLALREALLQMEA